MVMKRFFLLTMPRTGSTMMAERLDSHPDITCYLGLFDRNEFTGRHHPTTAALRSRLDDRWEDREVRQREHERFLDEVSEKTPECAAMGFKFHLSGPRHVAMWIVSTPGHKLVHLTRPNRLATWSSIEMVRQHGRNNATFGDAGERPTIAFDVESFEAHVKSRDIADNRCRALVRANDGLEISYAEARGGEGMQRVYRFLDVGCSLGGSPNVRKVNAENILDRFSNPDAVIAWIEREGRTEWLLPEI